jgi:succinate dehydrogenase / fumarate reductase flavoprotein subunit/L-aspartate oxidase
MMRVLRETVELDPAITLLNRCPVVELLSHEDGSCAGAVLYDLEYQRFIVVSARQTILATGGCGRLHLQGFPTSNHYGATADGLVLAYRLGAGLRDMDAFQYHPTGVAWPAPAWRADFRSRPLRRRAAGQRTGRTLYRRTGPARRRHRRHPARMCRRARHRTQ